MHECALASPAVPRESIFQPEWSPAGELHFVSDRTGWWNLYRARRRWRSSALAPMEAEFGVAAVDVRHAPPTPSWTTGASPCIYSQRRLRSPGVICRRARASQTLDLPYTAYRASPARERRHAGVHRRLADRGRGGHSDGHAVVASATVLAPQRRARARPGLRLARRGRSRFRPTADGNGLRAVLPADQSASSSAPMASARR